MKYGYRTNQLTDLSVELAVAGQQLLHSEQSVGESPLLLLQAPQLFDACRGFLQPRLVHGEGEGSSYCVDVERVAWS